jgi:hypothetical protein
MTATYTSSAHVRQSVKNIPAGITDTDIDRYIENAQTIIDATMKTSFLDTFDATKHSLLRTAATPLTALTTITYDPGTAFLELEDAEATIKLLTAEADRALKLLADPRTVAYLKSM